MQSRSRNRIEGIVDRISGSGNAMLKLKPRGQKNLGPLPSSIVGEEVVALDITGTWAVCLEPDYLKKDYLSFFVGKGLSREYIRESKLWEESSEDSIPVLSKLSVESDIRSPPPENLSPGDMIEVELSESYSKDGWIAHYQDSIVYLDVAFGMPGVTMNAEISSIDDFHITAAVTPAIKPQEGASVGDNILVETNVHTQDGTYGLFENIPVHIIGKHYPIGKQMLFGVEKVFTDHIDVSFDALDQERLPNVGATITPASGFETGTSVIDSFPFSIKKPLIDGLRSADIYVAKITSTEVEAVYNPSVTVSVSQGDEIVVEIMEVNEKEAICQFQEMPVLFSHGGRLTSALCGENVSVMVEEVQPDRLIASLTAPSLSTIEEDSGSEMTVLARYSDYVLGVAAQTPIVIESGHILDENDVLRVGINEVKKGYLEGSVAALPDCPSLGEVIRISPSTSSNHTLKNGIPVTTPPDLDIQEEIYLGVEEINCDSIFATVRAIPSEQLPKSGEKISASILKLSSSGVLALADHVPVLLPIYGLPEGTDVVVNVTDIKPEWIRGFMDSAEIQDSTVKFFDYQEQIQSGILEIYEGSFANAASCFTKATEMAEDGSGVAPILPGYTATISEVISRLKEKDIATAQISVENGLERLPETVENRQRQTLVDIFRLRLEAVNHLLEAIEGVSEAKTENPLQNIYQESVARSPLRSASRSLQEAKDATKGTVYEDIVPNVLLQQVLWLAGEQFSSSLQELHRWTPDSVPNMGEFTWPYQFLDEVHDGVEQENLNSMESSDAVEPISLDVETGISDSSFRSTESHGPESPSVESATSESRDGELSSTVDVNGSVTSELETAEGSPQNGSDDSSSHDEIESTVSELEAVEETATKPTSDGSSSNTDDSVTSESESFGVVNGFEGGERRDSKLSKLRSQAEQKAQSDPVRDTSQEVTVGSRYQRAPAIREYALARADGICECCGDPAPFQKPSGEPYLEVHHVNELGRGGEDHPDKVVALCPVCHKRIHHGENGRSINGQLRDKLEAGLADVGAK